MADNENQRNRSGNKDFRRQISEGAARFRERFWDQWTSRMVPAVQRARRTVINFLRTCAQPPDGGSSGRGIQRPAAGPAMDRARNPPNLRVTFKPGEGALDDDPQTFRGLNLPVRVIQFMESELYKRGVICPLRVLPGTPTPRGWETAGTLLGKGVFGHVLLGKRVDLNEIVARRITAARVAIKVASHMSNVTLEKIREESEILTACGTHENIVKLYFYMGSDYDPKKGKWVAVLCQEIVLGGTFKAFIEEVMVVTKPTPKEDATTATTTSTTSAATAAAATVSSKSATGKKSGKEKSKGSDLIELPTAPPLHRLWSESLISVLDWIHSQKISHRDLHTQNLMISEHGVLKVIDFGIARRQDSHVESDRAAAFRIMAKLGRAIQYAIGSTAASPTLDGLLLALDGLRPEEPIGPLLEHPWLATDLMRNYIAGKRPPRMAPIRLPSSSWSQEVIPNVEEMSSENVTNRGNRSGTGHKTSSKSDPSKSSKKGGRKLRNK